jgi:GH24 family phage-related lysozyme (muramidase)
MHISANGLRLIESFEGFSSAPYWDPYGHVWTRGYGETEGIGQHSRRISRGEAQARLQRLIEDRYEPAIRALGTIDSQNRWDALCSFVWNLGAGIFTGELRAALTEQRWQAAADQMLLYDHAGGIVLAGLKRRREEEVALFMRADPPYVPADEARWEKQWDALRYVGTPWAALRRRVLVRYMTARRKEIWRLGQAPGGWERLNRRARWWALLERTEPA